MKYLSMLLVFVFALPCVQSPCYAIAQDLVVVPEVAQEEVAENEEVSEDTDDSKESKEPKKPKTVKLKKKDLAIYKTVSGVVESTRVTEIETDFEQRTDLVVSSVRPQGTVSAVSYTHLTLPTICSV